jgi:hypothetical protein
MNTSTIIAVGYRARAGKDLVGQYLVDKWGFTRLAFADKLKHVVGTLFDADAFDQDFKQTTLTCGLTGGQALQQIGVKLREIHPNIWIESSGLGGYAMIPGMRVVVTDCRFKNEAAAVKRLGGHLVEVRRPVLPLDPHPSEMEGREINWDHVLENTTTIPRLYTQVDELVAGILSAAEGKRPAPLDPARLG